MGEVVRHPRPSGYIASGSAVIRTDKRSRRCQSDRFPISITRFRMLLKGMLLLGILCVEEVQVEWTDVTWSLHTDQRAPNVCGG